MTAQELTNRFWQLDSKLAVAMYLTSDERTAIVAEMTEVGRKLDELQGKES